MSIIQKLWWFFMLEKRRYLVGIVVLSLGFRPQSHSPMVMGRVIDAITSGQLTQQDLLLNLFYLLLAAFWDVLSALCLAHVYPWNFLPSRADHAVSPV